MIILAIDTSCDETAAAVTENERVLSNIIWSQASLHAKFGGVMPSLAQREHLEHIDWVITKALKTSKTKIEEVDAIAVTVGPGLSIALGVGIATAKDLAIKFNKKLIGVNHLEGHVLSPLANDKTDLTKIGFPAIGLIVSGGNTLLIKINKIGKYEVIAQTTDDALGEALDKGARMLGLGYPGGAVLEKMTKSGNANNYKLPVPIAGQEERQIFTYSGLKTAMMRLVEKEKPLTKAKIYDLSASFQDTAFKHLLRVIDYCCFHVNFKPTDFFLGGGVAANVELRKRLRMLGVKFGYTIHIPYTKKLYGDNAAMIGIAAYFKSQRGEYIDPGKIDRSPNFKIDS